ncbi:MAG: carbon-nitrogen hydrolase family protein [Rhizobiales bacterium]|nr:carbon-nitrogen hydrolase family protein [Hyphomicrobiales bacterium]
MTSSRFTAACIQMRSCRDVATNIAVASALIRQAAAEGAQFIATPEMTSLLETDRQSQFEKTCEEGADLALAVFCDVAKDCHIWLLIGSLAVHASNDKLANRSFLIGPDGAVNARYDKIHMFDVDLAGGESYRESRNYAAGERAVLADLPWGKLGMSVCYDLRFPHLYRQLAQHGAGILSVPAAFTRQTGAAHWHILLRARAIETGCYVMAPAQGGEHECGRKTYGHSLIIAPWGEVVAELPHEETGFVMAEIDMAKVDEARARVPSLGHDRAYRFDES